MGMSSDVPHIFSLCLAWLLIPRFDGALHVYRKVFTADVVIGDPLLSFSSATAAQCGMHCRRLSACRSFAINPAASLCWVYDNLAEFSQSGNASIGTTYFWMLSPECPAELGYALEGDLCYRVSTTSKDREAARTECMADGGHLFIGDERFKLSLILENVYSWIWLGASDVEVEGETQSVSVISMTGRFTISQVLHAFHMQNCNMHFISLPFRREYFFRPGNLCVVFLIVENGFHLDSITDS